MKRYPQRFGQHPIFSPIAFSSTFLLLAGLSVAVYLQGGRAFSPGALSAVNRTGIPLGGFMSHAELEEACNHCHVPFQGIKAARCESCHDEIARAREISIGLHGRIAAVEKCARCHPDHKGIDTDLVMVGLSNFDHEITSFSLLRHQLDYAGASLDCSGCHERESEFTVVFGACAKCHGANAPEYMAFHVEAFGDDCLVCHDGEDTLADFTIDDHTAQFVLVGAHAEAICESCHTGGQFADLPERCEGCHLEPATHAGLLTGECAGCHTADSWAPATLNGALFDHARDTRFSLVQHFENYDDSALTCLNCHTDQQFMFSETNCANCHQAAQPDFMDVHIIEVGTSCLNCHNGDDKLQDFDHNQVWPLEGMHRTVTCVACHAAPIENGGPRECGACHVEPDIHLGLFGTDCGACHRADGWLPARLIRHSFPLDHGGGGEIPCTTCHTGTYAEYTCYGCHDHEPVEIEKEHQEEGIIFPELADCNQCHPTGKEEEPTGDD